MTAHPIDPRVATLTTAGRTLPEIAAELGVTVYAVRLARARLGLATQNSRAPTGARKPVTVWLDSTELAQLDEHQAAHGLQSRGEAIRRLAFPARVIS